MVSRNTRNKNWFIQQFTVNEGDGLHDYLEEYKIVIVQREQKRMVFQHQSCQLYYRRCLVDHLKTCINHCYLSSYSLHLAIYLLDIIMDKMFIESYNLYLIANTCLLLAAKCEEMCYIIPTMSELNFIAKSSFPKMAYKVTEISILQLFNWYLLLPTAVHFVQLYMIRVIDKYDLNKNNLKYNKKNCRTLIYQIKEIVSKYLYQIVDDFHFIHNFPPSQQAAAIIFTARRTIGLNGWSKQLHEFTGYQRGQLQEPVDTLFKNRSGQCNPCCSYQ